VLSKLAATGEENTYFYIHIRVYKIQRRSLRFLGRPPKLQNQFNSLHLARQNMRPETRPEGHSKLQVATLISSHHRRHSLKPQKNTAEICERGKGKQSRVTLIRFRRLYSQPFPPRRGFEIVLRLEFFQPKEN